ncbi:type II CAAX endopeptidase family protein [Cohnella lubricantis]|uniref:CPBP family intramembrane metalloprotease n=1 Tax=Cohnella lubricantis TaxID=2163172 RepID=A0A841TA11_9BACL|nr:type II CAAX endopeptidase family protein [Cohnella lubricantis]MBB6676100.1 CPBP family intramembrane metalloprotease [Cohnella lubricantis]MBP2118058.1 membrane protease YdiL (CAAX protease family) [Cohnella lubricantis]
MSVHDRRRLVEVLAIIGFMLIAVFLVPSLKGLAAIVPIVYFLANLRRRGNDREQAPRALFTKIGSGIRRTWGWILLVAVGTQFGSLLLFKYVSPESLAHIQDRLPTGSDLSVALVLTILIAPLGEEIAYRGLFQERFSRYMPQAASIVIVSLLFAAMHYSDGPADVVFWDLFSVFIDSVLFGIIYSKTKNLYISYIAHLLADAVALTLMLTHVIAV